MKNLAMILVAAAAVCLLIGGWIVVGGGNLKYFSPNGLLRLADTALLLSITILLAAILGKKG